MTRPIIRAGRAHGQPTLGRLRLLLPTWLLVALAAPLAGMVAALAVNAASASRRWPGPLAWAGLHPWPVMLLATLASGLIAVELHRRAPSRAGPGGTHAPTTLLGRGWLTRAEQDRLRRELLGQVRRIWVDGFLHESLAEVVRIELDLAAQPDVIAPAWGALVRQPGQPPQPLLHGTPVHAIADRLGERLLILGAPGAGKTTLLLELARDWLERAEGDATRPIPVVAHLSAWPTDQPPLGMWLAEELRRRYNLSRRAAAWLVEHDGLAVLLDGLDEVPPTRRVQCANAINLFREAHGGMPLVVCARTGDYQDLAVTLQLDGAVEAQPLTRKQVHAWLQAAGRPMAGLRQVLRDQMHPLWALLDTPLLLAIATLAYHSQPARAIRTAGGISQLLDAYVARMLTRPRAALAAAADRPRYADADTLRWLRWLAGQIPPGGAFYPDWMQLDWLPSDRLRWLATKGLGLAVGVAAGLAIALLRAVPIGSGPIATLDLNLVFGMTVGLGVGLGVGLLASVRVGLGVGLAVGLAVVLGVGLASRAAEGLGGTLHIALREGLQEGLVFLVVFALIFVRASRGSWAEPVERLSWSPKRGLIGLVGGLAVGLAIDSLTWEVFGVATGLIGLAGALLGGLRVQANLQPATPGAGIRAAARSALGSGLAAGLVFVLGLWLIGGLSAILTAGGEELGFVTILGTGLVTALQMGGLIAAIVAGLANGGTTWLRHRQLVRLLAHDRLLPRDLLGFLEYAEDRVLLRRAGGGYLFAHRLLQEHLAASNHQSATATTTSEASGVPTRAGIWARWRPSQAVRARPSTIWYWLAAGLAVVGLASTAAWSAVSTSSTISSAKQFARVNVPGMGNVPVTHTGAWIVYYEGDDQPYLQDLGLKVLDPAGAVVPLRPYQGLEPQPYTPAGTGTATAVASFSASLVGTYQVSARPYDPAARSSVGEDLNAYQVAVSRLAVGDDLNKVIEAGILKAAVAGLAIVFAAAAIALVTSMRRAGLL
jgi:hypothetical protein